MVARVEVNCCVASPLVVPLALVGGCDFLLGGLALHIPNAARS
jgi:hypothetical protein